MNILEDPDPFHLFRTWLAAAEAAEPADANAMSVGTADADGGVSVRILLLKGIDARGFVFYTNLESRKGRTLSENPRASLCFHWKSLCRQVRVEGRVELVALDEADAYFHSRPRESQIGAWASRQSAPLESRAELDRRVEAAEARFFGAAVQRPDHWSGYRLVPDHLEFWHARPYRLHDRVAFDRTDGGWTRGLLHP
jgi:pyridoxamine 5'-phosphate oxidase